MKFKQSLSIIILLTISVFSTYAQNIDVITPGSLTKGTKYSIDVHAGFQLNTNISKESSITLGIRKGMDFLVMRNSSFLFGAGFERIDYNSENNHLNQFFVKAGTNQPIFWEWLRIQPLLGAGFANGLMQDKKLDTVFAFNLQMMFNIRLGKHFSIWTSPVLLDQATFVIGNDSDKGVSFSLGILPLGLRYAF